MNIPGRLALAVSACLLAGSLGAGSSTADDRSLVFDKTASDIKSVSARLGTDPVHCAQLPNRQICTWRLQSSAEHIVCDLDVAAPSADRPCLRTKDNLSMLVFPRARRRSDRARDQRQLSAEAKQQLDDASTLDAVVKLIGAGPIWCRQGDLLVCGWHAVRRTPGYVTLARVARAPGKKLAVVCRFAPDGLARKAGSCWIEKSGSPPVDWSR